MSGLRVAAFSKYFAFGSLCAVVMFARNAAYQIAEDSEKFQQTCGRVARYADQATSLEEYITSKGLSLKQIQSVMDLDWPSSKQTNS